MAAATAALPAPPQVLLMPGQTVRSRKTTTAHRQQMTSRHVRMLPFGGYPAPQNGQLKCRKGKQRLTACARWEGEMCGATRPGPSLLPSAKQASAWTLACAGCVISKPKATAGCGLACANAVARSSPAPDCRGSLRIFRGELEEPRPKVKPAKAQPHDRSCLALPTRRLPKSRLNRSMRLNRPYVNSARGSWTSRCC